MLNEINDEFRFDTFIMHRTTFKRYYYWQLLRCNVRVTCLHINEISMYHVNTKDRTTLLDSIARFQIQGKSFDTRRIMLDLLLTID
jgi:hypothetical protein